MICFSWTSRRPIRNLPKLLEAYNSRGGSIIEFHRVVSCPFFSRESSHYVWVPPNGSCALRSLPDTLTTLLFGWWGPGFFSTIPVLITNLGGGRDATQEILDATRGGNAELAQRALDEHDRAQRQESIRALLQLLGLAGAAALVLWLTAKATDWRTRRANSNQEVHARGAAGSPNRVGAAPVPSGKELRLQAIFYNANGRSTAIIDRNTVSVGELISGYTVQAIGPQSVTVRSTNGQEKMLHLSNQNL